MSGIAATATPATPDSVQLTAAAHHSNQAQPSNRFTFHHDAIHSARYRAHAPTWPRSPRIELPLPPTIPASMATRSRRRICI